MAELTTAAVVPDVTNKVIHPPPQRGTLKVLACAVAVFAAVVAVPCLRRRVARPHGVPSYLEADGADVMRQRASGRASRTCRRVRAQLGAQFGAIHRRLSSATSDAAPLRVCGSTEADWVCCENRHYAERAGRWTSTAFLWTHRRRWRQRADHLLRQRDRAAALQGADRPVVARFCAREPRTTAVLPRRRAAARVRAHPAQRRDGSVNGTHLGHNLPDSRATATASLCSVAGLPAGSGERECVSVRVECCELPKGFWL